MPNSVHYLAKTNYEVDDEEILSAIAYHTTGRPNMTILEEILYVADYIEPERHHASNLPSVRRLAFEDIEKSIYRFPVIYYIIFSEIKIMLLTHLQKKRMNFTKINLKWRENNGTGKKHGTFGV